MGAIGRYLKPQDAVWLILFGALHAASPVRHDAEIELLIALAVLQLATPRIAWFGTPAGTAVAIALKMLLGWLLIGVTNALASNYYVILLLPVVAAATAYGAAGSLVVSLAAAGAYLSFLLFVPPGRLAPEEIRDFAVRALFFPLVGFFTAQMAAAARAEAKRAHQAALQLNDANRQLRQAEDAVRRADRLAALGQLTAGLAHELRNPLGTIKNSAELLAKAPPGSETAKELVGYIVSEVERANLLVTRFLRFAKPAPLHLREASIGDLLDRAVLRFRQGNPSPRVSVFRNDSPDVPPIALDTDMIEQVFLNLLCNAAEASPEGGVVTIKTRPAPEGVEVSFIDRGAGIDPAHREQIFNPFFSTKPDGVGLGLAIVSKIVDQHNGRIMVDSVPGEGSVFRVWLPMRPL